MCECQSDFYTLVSPKSQLPTDYPQIYPQRVFTGEGCCDIFSPRLADSEGGCRGPLDSNGRVDPSVSTDAGQSLKGPLSDPSLRDFYAQFIPEWRAFAPCGR